MVKDLPGPTHYSASQRHIVLAARVGVRLRRDRALTGRAATRIIDPCARKRPVATCFGAPSPGRRLSARSALAASPRSLGRSTHGASASGLLEATCDGPNWGEALVAFGLACALLTVGVVLVVRLRRGA